MNSRWVAVGITLFWIVMNALLWRLEWRGGLSALVPLGTVAQRLLEAADNSTLQIRQGGLAVGQLRWNPTVLHDAASASNQLADEGMVTGRTGYAVDFDLNLVASGPDRRGRGTGRFEFNLDRSWRSLEFRFTQKPVTYEFRAASTNALLNLRVRQGTDVIFTQELPLNDPIALLRSLDAGMGGFGLLTPGLLSGWGVLAGERAAQGLPGRLPDHLMRWEARAAELPVSRQRIRTFQMTTVLLDHYRADVWIGRNGELLRATLPGDIELRDESLPAAR